YERKLRAEAGCHRFLHVRTGFCPAQKILESDATMTKKTPSTSRSDFDEAALFFHRYPKPGKLEIQATKPLGNQRDLALAYSPGVAAPCLAIHEDPATAAEYTARGNLVAVVSNGTAVLGLGNIGALA